MEDWEQRLVSAGRRITAPRRAVMDVLETADGPLSPRQIQRRAQAMHRDLGLVTVYRTLSTLSQLNLVRRVHCEDGCHAYVLATPGHHHSLVCRACGRTVEFPGYGGLQTLVARVEAETGYQIEDHLLQLFGLCPACKEEQA